MNRMQRVVARMQPYRLRRSIGARVLAGFGLTAVIAVAVAVISLWYNTSAGRDLARVTERDRAISADFRDLEVAVEQQSGAVQNYLLSGEQQDLNALNAGRVRFYAALDRLEAALPAGERGEGLAEIRRRAMRFDEVATEEIGLFGQGWTGSANFLWREDGMVTKTNLVEAIQQQIAAHNATVDDEIASSRAHLRYAFGIAIGLVVLAAALALMIGIGITRAVSGGVRNLVQVASAVRGGDLTVKAPVQGEDELAVLAVTMNAMVESLATSRAQLEQALVETERSEAQYRILTDNAGDIIFALDRHNIITFINPAAERILGYRMDELINQSVEMIYTRATMEFIRRNSDWVVNSPHLFSAEIELVAKDGRIIPVEVNCSVMKVNGVATGIQGVARDMTERHRMEQQLRRLHLQDRRRVDQLVTLNEFGRKIAALQTQDALLPSLVQTLGSTFGYHHVRLLLLNDMGDLETSAAWHLPDTPGATESEPLSPLIERALDGDAGYVADRADIAEDGATRYGEVAVPLRSKNDVLGVLNVRGSTDGGLDESDIFTLQTLAGQVAVAVENARLYAAGQQLAVSEERNRLARELHDSVTQELFSMTMMAGALPALMERKPELARERLGRLHDLARGALAEMRALLFALRPAALAEEGLVSALTKHAAAFESRENIKVHLDIHADNRLPQPCEEAFFRIAQEAMHNVVKHAQAENVWVTLQVGDDESTLTVRDDGAGFDPISTPPGAVGMGLSSMRERVQALKGSWAIDSAPGSGTTIHIRVPVGAATSAVA